MQKFKAIIRGSLHTIVNTLVVIFVALYLALRLNLTGWVASYSLTDLMSEQLGTRVTIDGQVDVDWRNQIVLNRLTIYDQQDDTLLYARRVMMAYDLLPLLQHNLVLNTCQLIDFEINGRKAEGDSVANYQFVIDALSKKNPDSPSFIDQVDLNAILLRQGRIAYNQYKIEDLGANLHLHGNNLQIKKMHFAGMDAQVKADRCNIDLGNLKYLTQEADEACDIFELKGLQIEHPDLICKALAKGASDGIAVELTQCQLPRGTARIPGIRSASLRSSLFATHLSAPLDSIYLTADIHEATMKTDTLGTVDLKAHLEGMLCDALVHAEASTALGNVVLDGQAQNNVQDRTFGLKGHCLSPGFELSSLLPASAQLGKIALNADFEVRHDPAEPLWLALDGDIDELEYRQHTYHDIVFKGGGSKKDGIKGNIVVNDSLGKANLDFDLDLEHSQKRYKIDGIVQQLQPNALHLTDQELTDSLAITSKIHADMLASGWHDAEGELQLTDILLQRNHKSLTLEPILFEGTADRGQLSSQLLQMNYQRKRRTKAYSVAGRIPVLNTLADLLNRPERMTNDAHFALEVDSLQQLKNLTLDLPTVFLNQNSRVSLYAEMEKDSQGALLPIIDFSAGNEAHSLSGTLKGEVFPDPMEITLFPTSLLYNNVEELTLNGAHVVRTEEGNLAIQDFSVKGADQSISASGILGKNGSKDFIVQLDRFELSQIFRNFDKGYLQFAGKATGDVVFSSEPDSKLHTEGLEIEDFTYIDTIIGDARLNLDFLINTKRIDVDCRFLSDKRYRTHAYGDIRLGPRDSLDLMFDTDHLPLGFINYWTGNILQQFYGNLTGNVRLFGDAKRLELAGHPVVDGRFTHSLLDAHFHFNDTVHLEHNLLYLSNVTFDDCHGHPMQLNAQVKHDHLSKFEYDVNIVMPEANQGFLVLDRQQAPGRMYWGQLYASGQAQLRGGKGQHRINLNVATTDKSWFYLSPREKSFEQDDASYTFLTFRNQEDLEMQEAEATHLLKPLTYEELAKATEKENNAPTDLQVDMQINATEHCQVYVQMDPLAEDRLTCRGRGNLALHYDPRRDIQLTGTYNISSGSYSMSMRGDLMNKVFQLQNTSTVRFSGVPSEAELALDARYSIPSVNLRDLDEGITTLGSLSRSSVPVDCMLAVTGQLSSPQVSFDLEVKSVSDEIQAYVHNVIGTQEMLNQEVLYLLLFSKFYTPQYVQSSQARSGSELTSFASASITSQLNQLLGHVSNNFTMGTNFRSDKGDFTDMEMDLSLSTRLLDDRLLLNGNVGYRDPANHLGATGNRNSFIGDFDLEFLLNQKGTVRVKAYSHYNERDYSINNALTTQGIGFILRKDFKNFQDLFLKRKLQINK